MDVHLTKHTLVFNESVKVQVNIHICLDWMSRTQAKTRPNYYLGGRSGHHSTAEPSSGGEENAEFRIALSWCLHMKGVVLLCDANCTRMGIT